MIKLPETVYVLDDNHSFLKATLRLLQSSGFQAEGFLSGQELAERFPFPRQICLIIDIVLGRENGLDVVQDLSDRSGTVPVVFVSATENAEFLTRAEQMTGQ
ncbi:MAG: response regulator, partial [Parasphingorhabdus sp.]|uniref:response regulator n=1 Tax=Parasphingorhabdus sp. TaxID=2709688 RepID=UPI003297B8DA